MSSTNFGSIHNDPCPDSERTDTAPALDPAMLGMSDRYFTSIKEDSYRAVRPTERDMLAIPWGPRLDVIFDPKGAAGIVGGRLRIMGRTGHAEVELANVVIASPDQALFLTASGGCEQYVIKASLGSDPGLAAKRIDSYFFARVYSSR